MNDFFYHYGTLQNSSSLKCNIDCSVVSIMKVIPPLRKGCPGASIGWIAFSWKSDFKNNLLIVIASCCQHNYIVPHGQTEQFINFIRTVVGWSYLNNEAAHTKSVGLNKSTVAASLYQSVAPVWSPTVALMPVAGCSNVSRQDKIGLLYILFPKIQPQLSSKFFNSKSQTFAYICNSLKFQKLYHQQICRDICICDVGIMMKLRFCVGYIII